MNVDIKELKDAYFRNRKNVTWNMSGPPEDVSPIYWDNPYYVRYENYESDSRYRYISYVTLNYKATDWLNLMGRVSLDNYSGVLEERTGFESVNIPGYNRTD